MASIQDNMVSRITYILESMKQNDFASTIVYILTFTYIIIYCIFFIYNCWTEFYLYDITSDKDNDLSDEQVQRILSRVKPAMKKWLNITDLLPFLKRHHVLTDSELQFLKTSTLRQREQVC